MVYLPPAFTEAREEILVAHIERHDFGLLLTGQDGRIDASHLPFLTERRDGRLYLHAHLARANPQLADLARISESEAGEVLAVFSGPHAYISPSWYATTPAVPTWNYTAVHAYGRPRLIEAPDELRQLIDRLSQKHESRETEPWQMQGLPERYITGMMKGIVGIEIAVERLEGKFKLSQNRTAADRAGVIATLAMRDDDDAKGIVQLMREREPG